MLIILANRQDEGARTLPARWQSHDAHVVTPADLSMRGWRHQIPFSPDRARAVVGNREIAWSEISGVLTRLPCVSEQDLPHFMETDRAYAAAEMTAFLLAWLSELDCPMLNRPVAGCLCGPIWRPEKWVRQAAHLGIPVAPVRRMAPQQECATPDSSATDVVVVGNRCIGAAHPVVHDRARLLARTAGVDLLHASFSGPDADARFIHAHVWPDLWNAEIADAILDYFQRRTTC